MYQLLPWKSVSAVLTIIVALAIYVDEIEAMTGLVLPDHIVIRYLPLILLVLFVVIFGSYGRWAPWRCIWKICPQLNNWLFPDINGIWVGSTHSNWPIVLKMHEAAQDNCIVTQEELVSIPLQTDAMAMEIKATLFKVQIIAGLSATNGQSFSITVRPMMDDHKRLHLIYVYQQDTPLPILTDADNHLGAADLVIEMGKAEGVYWTRRSWNKGLNTAGRLELRRTRKWREKDKSISDYAAEE